MLFSMFILVFLFQTAVAVELYYNSSLANNYTLGPNLFVNPSLDLTLLSSTSLYEFFPGSILGWTCNNEC